MPTVEEFFAPWESQSASITNWATMLNQINRVLEFVGDRSLAWRGLSDAGYSLHSTLYRHLSKGASVSEDELVEFETKMLDVARTRWRFDNLSALELLAQFQHLGAPTRLLDVTFNPLIALWFAVEPKYDKGELRPDIDGRLVAYDVTNRQINLSDEWGGRDLPWRKRPDGWTNQLPRVWRPPSYNERIPAQDSAFLLGGIPAGSSRFYRRRPGDSTNIRPWRRDEFRAITSVPTKMWSLDYRPLYPRSTPTLTIRIPADAKADIRRVLDHRFGINTASVYPDMYGLAQHGWKPLDF
ncbi:FRG domain-containing protein [Microbacterium resistens]|uniref:FRG domain-containing protein n=1 Tax=Microbacterium resistens TaxID=156977 RepID=UPI001C571A23|nr:FRG domain-containing protein [Microbacterium resistens]MBW1640051.1 FRG domain-containing protein [Microbacterium resistens]